MENINRILDVGCGSYPSGHVNIDLYVGSGPHSAYQFVDPSSCPNFVNADCNFLPFQDNSFEIVRCYHVLEHKGVNFSKTLFDMLRVCREHVVFIVPHYLEDRGKRRFEGHDKSFNIKVLDQFFKKHRLAYDLKVAYRSFPHKILSLVKLPSQIKVIVYKKYRAVNWEDRCF